MPDFGGLGSTYSYTGSGPRRPSVSSTSSKISGSLERLVIEHETKAEGVFDGRIPALFNPAKVVTNTTSGWRGEGPAVATGQPAALVPPTSPEPTVLDLDLFFDTAMRPVGGGRLAGVVKALETASVELTSAAGLASEDGSSVLDLTARVFALTQIARELHRPPFCRLWWGTAFLIEGALTSLTQEFTRFKRDGTPIRATLSCKFTQRVEPSVGMRLGELFSPDVEKRYTAARGDTLTRIAAKMYGDPSEWRAIARANKLSDPLDIVPGRVMVVPKLTRD